MSDRKHRAASKARAAEPAARPARHAAPSLALVALMLFASGASALVFQVAWMRELRLVFGATTASVAAVLAVFMGGIGVGSAVLGRRADRSANPLRMYGRLEMAVALAVAVSPLLVTVAGRAYFGMGGQERLGLAGATLVRLLLTAVVLGVPTVLMGGTLPAAVRAITAEADARRRSLAVLYGANTLGAVCGAFFATFVALEAFGTDATVWIGCAVNLSVGALAVLRARGIRDVTPREVAPAGDDRAGASASAAATATESAPRVALYGTAALLGFTFFALELVWYRMLAPILGGTTFTFGLILCVALLGIGLGGAAYHPVFRRLKPTASVLAVTCALEAALVALPYALGDRLALLAGHLAMQSPTFEQIVTSWFVVMSIVVLPAALVSGLQFPLLVALLGRGRAAVSRQLGFAYAWNTVGAIAGSLVVGFGALPLLTAPGTWRAVVAVLALLAAAWVLRSWRTARGTAIAVVVVVALAFAGVAQRGPTAVWRHSGIGAGRGRLPVEGWNATMLWIHEHRRNLIWEAEGIESSIGITAPDGLSFVINGKNDGNAVGDAGTQIGVPIIGAMLHPAPRTGLVIGLGTGESAGWLASMPGMERVDVLELEPALDEMARRSSSLNRDVLRHPKVRRIYNDGREHVFTTGNRYDLILSEPSNPYRAGVASLYTAEFYRRAHERLNRDGMFLQWVQAYEVDPQTISIVLATARSVFEHVEVWQSLPGDLEVVCSRVPIDRSAAALRERIADPAMREALHAAWHIDDLEGFLAHFVANRRFVDALVRSAEIPKNSDDRTVLEYRFARTVGANTGFTAGVIRQAAQDAAEQRPEYAADGVDWDLVDARRLEFDWMCEGEVAPDLQPTPRLAAAARAFLQLRAGQFQPALLGWSADSLAPRGDVERLARARCYAELGRPECLALIDPIEAKFPAESAAIRAAYHWRRGHPADAAPALEAFYAALEGDPWAITPLVNPALELTVGVAAADTSFRRRMFDRLARPLPSHRFEYQRPMLRLLISEHWSQATALEALEGLEPNPPWDEATLKLRAETYAAVHHPLATRAARDWQAFQRHATP